MFGNEDGIANFGIKLIDEYNGVEQTVESLMFRGGGRVIEAMYGKNPYRADLLTIQQLVDILNKKFIEDDDVYYQVFMIEENL